MTLQEFSEKLFDNLDKQKVANKELDKIESQLDVLEKEAINHTVCAEEIVKLLYDLVKSQKSITNALVTVGVTGFVCLAVTYIAAAFAIFWG